MSYNEKRRTNLKQKPTLHIVKLAISIDGMDCGREKRVKPTTKTDVANGAHNNMTPADNKNKCRRRCRNGDEARVQ